MEQKQINNIPQELKDLKQWICWKKIEMQGKTTKIPVNPYTCGNAQSNNPKTWATFEKALNSVKEFDLDGIGFMFKEGYFGVDLDNCSNELKNEFINTLQSYTELSQSGNGIHIICKGTLPAGQRRKGNVEMYENGRFFVMTGDKIGNYNIIDGTEKIKILHEKHLQPKITQTPAYVSTPVNNAYKLTDDEIIKKAFNSKNGNLFQSLYTGNYESIYNSQSEADIAFCNLLAFWTQKDFEQIDRIFRTSGLYRDKWDRKTGQSTYGKITISNAISSCKAIYAPNYSGVKIDLETGEVVGEAKEYGFNDTGNARRLYDKYGTNIKYNVDNKNFMLWNGKYWKTDLEKQVKNLAEDIANDLKLERLQLQDEELIKAYDKNITKILNTSGKEAMIKELQHIEDIPITNHDLDKYINLLNTKDGIIDLTTGDLLPHKKELLISKLSNCEVSYDEPKRWLQFLDEIFLSDKELINYIQKAVGYSLTGSTKEQCLFICYGEGSNGKSVFLDIVSQLLGDYSAVAQVDTILINNKTSGANSDIARLKGARFVTTSEPNENSKLNEGLVKQLTGGDKVAARFLYGNEFEFTPEFKIWLATNHKPIIRGTDNGIWRRIHLIPFEATFTKQQQDKNLTTKLLAELPSILNWAIEGCRKWQDDGLEVPQLINDITKQYKAEMDVVTNFINDCALEVLGERAKASTVYQTYNSWAKRNNEYQMSQTRFGKELCKRFERIKLSDGIYYINLKLNKEYVYE